MNQSLVIMLAVSPFLIWGLLVIYAQSLPDDEAPEQTQS